MVLHLQPQRLPVVTARVVPAVPVVRARLTAAALRRAAVQLPVAVLLPKLAAVPLLKLVAVLQLPKLAAVLLQAAVPLPSNRDEAIAELIDLSGAMAREGRALIERVLPDPPESYTQWSHYPEGDAIDPDSNARWFYHAHPPEQRGEREHGHFHIFLPLSAFDGLKPLTKPKKKKAAKVVHVAALCFDVDGLPTHWITTNQWVTEEFLFDAEAIIARLDQLDMTRAGEKHGMEQLGRWLTLAMVAARTDLTRILQERDVALADVDFRDRDAEILSQTPFVI